MSEIKEKIKQVETPVVEISQGRQEDYFFPDERITIKASSLEEAKEKLKEIKKQ